MEGYKAGNHKQHNAAYKYLFQDLREPNRGNHHAYGYADQGGDEFCTVHGLYVPPRVDDTSRISE